MPHRSLPGVAGFILGIAIMMTTPASADALKDEIAPTGKLRVAIAISPAGGAFWSTKTESGYAGVPVDLGREMAAQLGVPVEYVAHNNSGHARARRNLQANRHGRGGAARSPAVAGVCSQIPD